MSIRPNERLYKTLSNVRSMLSAIQNLHAFGTKKLCLGNVFRRAGKSAAVKLTILLVDYTYDKTVILVQTKSYQGS